MARNDMKTNTFASASYNYNEAPEMNCPACGEKVEIGEVWYCTACRLNGLISNSIWFEHHIMDLPSDKSAGLISNTTHCFNGVLRIGDYVLSIADDIIPCLPGQVTAISHAVTDGNGFGSQKDNVYVNFVTFSDEFSESRKQEVAEFYGNILQERCSFEQVNCGYVVLNPDCLIKINDVAPETMKEMMESEENAIRYALRVVRSMVSWPWRKDDLSD